MLNLNNPTCQLINGTVSERSLWAEKMSVTHSSARCSKHSLFHNWVEIPTEQRRETINRRLGVRFDGYVEQSPGKWVLRDVKPSKKKASED